MNLFLGDYNSFYKFVGGYARNKTLLLTKKHKSGVCACCGRSDVEIQSAHKRGLERTKLVRCFFDNSVIEQHEEKYLIDMDKFENAFTKFSSDLSNFHFLCEKCHKKYDRYEIDESDFCYKSASIK